MSPLNRSNYDRDVFHTILKKQKNKTKQPSWNDLQTDLALSNYDRDVFHIFDVTPEPV